MTNPQTPENTPMNVKPSSMTGRRRLFLLRHGHVDYFNAALSDPRMVDLTEDGRRQAEATAKTLANIEFDMAMCSGLPRTRQTAEIILQKQQSAPSLMEDEGFEEIKSGWVTANSREELAARLAYCFDQAGEPNARFLPDGETFEAVEKRTVASLQALIQTRHWKTGLLVAHEGVNRVILGWCTGGGLNTINAFEQDLCAINVIDFDITPAEADDRGGSGVKIERKILKLMNVTAYDVAKNDLRRTSLEHLFGVDFGASRPIEQPTD